MGNCCSDVAGGRTAIGGTAGGLLNPGNASNDAVDNFFKSRGYQGLFSQIEVLTFLFHLRYNTKLNYFNQFSIINRFWLVKTAFSDLQLSFSASGLRDRDVLSKVWTLNSFINLLIARCIFIYSYYLLLILLIND